VPLLGLEGVALSPCNKMLHLRNLAINLKEKKKEGGTCNTGERFKEIKQIK
jgi:hypothetical protein